MAESFPLQWSTHRRELTAIAPRAPLSRRQSIVEPQTSRSPHSRITFEPRIVMP